MDLTKLYNFSTQELRQEAERLGVTDTYALSRAQLIHSIRSRVGEPPPEGFFGRVVGFAKRALQASTAPTAEPHSSPAPQRRLTEGPESPSQAPNDEPSRTSRRSEVPSLFRAPAPPPRTDGPASKAPAGVFSGGASKFEEPFPTLTMARILAQQGHYRRSLAIYAGLIRETPEDTELQIEADAVRAQSRARRPSP